MNDYQAKYKEQQEIIINLLKKHHLIIETQEIFCRTFASIVIPNGHILWHSRAYVGKDRRKMMIDAALEWLTEYDKAHLTS